MTRSATKYLTSVSAVALTMTMAASAFAADVPAAARYEDPAPAARTISGHIDVMFGKRYEDNTSGYCSTGGECEPWLVQGDARVDIPYNENWSLQIDFGGVSPVNYTHALSSDDEWDGSMWGGGHINYRQMDQYLVGVFGGLGRYWIPSDEDDNATGFVAGIEGQYYWNDLTLYAQAGVIDMDSGDDGSLEDAWFVRGQARYYFNSGHTKVQGEVAYASGRADSDDATLWALGAEIEHQVYGWGNDGHASVFASYDGVMADTDDDNESPTDHRFMVGMKFALNQYSLKTEDRSGATLELPNFTHWSSTVCIAECN